MWPQIGPVAFDDTVRLIPGRYAEDAERALADLADNDDELDQLIRLAAATNSRLQAQVERHPAGLGRADLIFGIPYSKIINSAFSYGGQGARFHPPGPKGAWYCAVDVATCLAEVAYHRIRHLRETGVADEEAIPYRLFLADIHAQEFALLDDRNPATLACLDPDSYVAGQALGAHLRGQRRGGVCYPSVRHSGGTCIAVLAAPIVANVRRDALFFVTISDFAFAGAIRVDAPDLERSRVTVHLADFAGEFLSRSEARRLSAQLDQFAEVILDFAGVESVGQAFVDELFRVFARQSPGTLLIPVHMSDEVELMVRRGLPPLAG